MTGKFLFSSTGADKSNEHLHFVAVIVAQQNELGIGRCGEAHSIRHLLMRRRHPANAAATIHLYRLPDRTGASRHAAALSQGRFPAEQRDWAPRNKARASDRGGRTCESRGEALRRPETWKVRVGTLDLGLERWVDWGRKVGRRGRRLDQGQVPINSCGDAHAVL